MSSLPFVNIPSWAPDQVVSWLKGLDEAVLAYVPLFLKRQINGKQLLLLTHTDLRDMGIFRLGHRELILEAIEMLRSLFYELEYQTVQSLALQLSCKSIGLGNDVLARLHDVLSNNRSCPESYGRVPLPILASVSDLIGTIKQLVSWLDRAPFDTSDEFTSKRNRMIRLGMELLESTQKDHPVECETEIMNKCRSLSEFADGIIRDSMDSLVIQPVSLEICTLRKKPEDDLGMHLSSLYNGTHIIGSINDQSPADLCGKVDEGDELVQVNYQTVVGWHLTNLVAALKDNQKEVTLTLKKRPRHVNLFGPNNHRKKVPKNVQQSTFPKSFSRKSKEDKATRTPLKTFLDTVPTQFNKESSQEPDSDTESEVFQTTPATPSLLPLPLEPAKQRRATVSGGSPPTGKRELPELDTPTRPKSFTLSSPGSDVGSPGSDLLSPRFLEQLTHSTDRTLSTTSASSSSPKKHGARRTSSTSTPKSGATPSVTVETSRATVTLTPPVTQNASVLKTSMSDNNIQIRIPVLDSPTHRRKSTENAGMVAKATDGKGSPQLLSITRINSQRRTEMYDQNSSDEQESPKMKEKMRSRSQGGAYDPETSPARPGSYAQSYTVNIVGGVLQKVVVNKDSVLRDSPTQSPSGLLRRKHFMRHMGAHRRVSCKDLGHGDCQGWLYKRKEGTVLLHSKWVKRWFILKQRNMYYYKSQEDEKAQGVIHLPGFKVSHAPDVKSKKFAFKAFHTGMTFYFASDRQEDMVKWMNKMGVAAIAFDTSHINTTAGFRKPSETGQPYYSESDDEDSGKSTPTTPSTSRGVSPYSSREDLSSLSGHENDPLCKQLRRIHVAELDIDGKNPRNKRVSSLAKAEELDISNPGQLEIHRRWNSLHRTLKAKERELGLIEGLIRLSPATSASLAAFRAAHPEIFEPCVAGPSDLVSSDGSISESADL